MNKTDSFWDWAEKRLDVLGLTWYGVEKMTGLSNAAISKRARERLPPTLRTCEAISSAFKVPKKEVLKIAGLLPGEPSLDDEQTQWVLYLFDSLTFDDQERLLIIMRSLVDARQKDTGKQGGITANNETRT